MQKQFEELESKISALKEQKSKIENELGDPEIYSNMNKFQETEKKYNHTVSELKSAEAQYEKVFEDLMEFGDQ